jgi:hypothetical protein
VWRRPGIRPAAKKEKAAPFGAAKFREETSKKQRKKMRCGAQSRCGSVVMQGIFCTAAFVWAQMGPVLNTLASNQTYF